MRCSVNKLYKWDLYDKNKINMDSLATTRYDAWITSGYVIAETVEEAKKKLKISFTKLNNGNYILNFDLGEEYKPYYAQDNRNSDVFIDEDLLDK